MNIAVFIIDTSYLLEMFSVPNHSTKSSVKEIKNRLKNAIEQSSRLYVPLPCLFELANHIAHEKDGRVRKRLAKKIYTAIESSVTDRIPWNITPSKGIEELPYFFKVFAEEFVIQNIGLTDTTVIQEAKRLKNKYKDAKFTVHIWTKDNKLKTHEPDRENNPFLG